MRPIGKGKEQTTKARKMTTKTLNERIEPQATTVEVHCVKENIKRKWVKKVKIAHKEEFQVSINCWPQPICEVVCVEQIEFHQKAVLKLNGTYDTQTEDIINEQDSTSDVIFDDKKFAKCKICGICNSYLPHHLHSTGLL